MAKKRSNSSTPRRSFKRSYREDFYRDMKLPGVAEHFYRTFQILTSNYKLFLPLLGISVVFSIATVGLGEVVNQSSLAVFMIIIFLIIWLVTIFALRHIMARHKISFRDALYNSMAPLISVFLVLVVIALESLPIVLLVLAYSAAVETNFLTMPFYALVFLCFAIAMVLMSGYMLSSSIMALVAATAPGLYPLMALKNAADLMIGQRMKLVLRLIALMMVSLLVWAVVILPLRALSAAPIVISAVQTVLFCAFLMFAATYLYMYYRWMLADENMLK